MDTAPDPGLYYDIPFDEYCSWPCLNNSSLAYATRSWQHYRYAPSRGQTPAMALGSFIHSVVLERDKLHREYVPEPDLASKCRKPDGTEYANPKATKQYKELMAEYRELTGDKQLVPPAWFDLAEGMLRTIDTNDRAKSFLALPGANEVSAVWDDRKTGIRCKARCDRLCQQDNTVVDLKTTADAGAFEKSIYNFGYHRQAAFYLEGVETICGGSWRFAIVAVEKELPYGVRAAFMGKDALDAGRDKCRKLLAELAECRSSGDWPGYENPDEWTLPGWALTKSGDDEIGISINGEIVI